MHLVLVDLRDSELDGQQAEDRLHEIGITVNRNAVPFDPRPPVVSSRPARRRPGARHARPAGRATSREIGRIIATALQPGFDGRAAPSWPSASTAIAERYPLYAHLRRARRRSDGPRAGARAGPAILAGA